MMLTETLRNWQLRNRTQRALSQLSQRQLEDIGAFEARNAEKMRPYLGRL
jgi:uncharacterized protein YjiS (DUF1127 family)